MTKARVCHRRGCFTRLASYNPGPYCYTHTELAPSKMHRAPRRSKTDFATPGRTLEDTRADQDAYQNGEW